MSDTFPLPVEPARARLPARIAVASLVAALCTGALNATARDPVAGRDKAQACAVCHGPNGLSTVPDAPHLAGQPAIYLAAQLKAYRNGTRKHEVMNVISRPLSDADIDNLAAWYASIRVEATLPN